MQPVLSIIIPAYNAEEYLEETIRAVFRQSYQDWELLVINNASADNTAGILEKLQKEFNDPRLRIISNDHTLSACVSWNIAIGQARGEFIKLICADDLPEEGSFERQVHALKSHPSASMATGARVIINGLGKKLFTTNRLGNEGLYQGRVIIKRCSLAGTNIIGDPVHVMWTKSAMAKVGSFDPDVRFASDLEFWMRLLSVGDLYYHPEPVGLYRIHNSADSSGQWKRTTEWVLKIIQMQKDSHNIELTKFNFQIITLKAYIQGFIRGQIYKFLG